LVEPTKLDETLFKDLPRVFKLEAMAIIPAEADIPLNPKDINVFDKPSIVGKAAVNTPQGTNEKEIKPLVADFKLLPNIDKPKPAATNNPANKPMLENFIIDGTKELIIGICVKIASILRFAIEARDLKILVTP
jgi:hypothetical protein